MVHQHASSVSENILPLQLVLTRIQGSHRVIHILSRLHGIVHPAPQF